MNQPSAMIPRRQSYQKRRRCTQSPRRSGRIISTALFLVQLVGLSSPFLLDGTYAFVPSATSFTTIRHQRHGIIDRYPRRNDCSVDSRLCAIDTSTEEQTWGTANGATDASDLKNKNGTEQPEQRPPRLPFLIERLPRQPPPRVFDEISDMCIDAFFNTAPHRKKLWTEWQLAYLRNLQRSDLKVRRQRDHRINMMFVARRVVPADASSVRQTPLLLDTSRVHNLPSDDQSTTNNNSIDYVRGEIVGFVEVTQRPYGLGDASAVGVQLRTGQHNPKRPVLTNLSVRASARGCGVGSRLMVAAEEAVRRHWRMDEMILEVEDDNGHAQEFYERRGYQVLFEDPASRKYDTSGLFLQQIRCKRIIMRKDLLPAEGTNGSSNALDAGAAAVESTVKNLGAMFLQRLFPGPPPR